MSKILLLILSSFFFVECLIEEPKILKLKLGSLVEKTVGKKGTIVIETSQEGTSYIIEETNRDTCIQAHIIGKDGKLPIECGL